MGDLKLLMLEDSPDDAVLIQSTLNRAGLHFKAKVVSTRKDFIEALDSFDPGFILSDHRLCQFSSIQALHIVRKKLPYIPFILIAGTVPDEFAASIIKEGLDDYILKNDLKRLPAAIQQAIEKKQTEKAEALFASIVNSSDDAIISMTLDGTIMSWNKGAEMFFGYSGAGVIGKNISLLIPSDRLNEEPEMMEKIKRGEFIKHYETQRRHKNGNLIHVSLTVSPIKNTRGNTIGASKIARNITDRREAELKIIQSEENLKAIFDNAPEGFILTDATGLVEAFNEVAKESILFTRNEEIKNGKSIFNFIEGEKKASLNMIFSKVLQGKIIQFDHLYTDVDSRITWINLTFSPVKKSNSIKGVSITGRDITQKKIAEQQKEFDQNNLYSLINNTKDLMWSVDRNFNLITFNDSFNKAIKRTSDKPLAKGDNVLSAQFTKVPLKRYKIFYDRALSGEAFTIVDHFDSPAGFWSEISFYPMHQGDEVIGTACFSRDITERKKAEEELKKSNERFLYATQATSDIIWEQNFETKEYLVHEGKEKFLQFNKILNWQLGLDGKSIVKEDRSRVKKSFLEARTDPACGLWKDEYRFNSPGNIILHIINQAILFRDEQGKAIRAIGAISNITEKKKLEAALFEQHRTEQLKITATTIEAQEKERHAIGIELHDNVNQILVGTKLFLSMIKYDPANSESMINSCVDNLQKAIDENRKIAHELVAPDFKTLNLTEQISALTVYMLGTSGVGVQIDSSGLCEELLDDQQKLAVYRIAQEQCTNIVKYAKARVVKISLTTAADFFRMIVADDGVGMETGKKTKGIGLINISGRLSIFNGTANINTAPRKGFTLEIIIPFKK